MMNVIAHIHERNRSVTQVMKNLFQFLLLCVLVLGLLVTLNFFLPKGTGPESLGYPPPEENTSKSHETPYPYPPPHENQPTPTHQVIEPKCFIDQLNQFSLQLPTGWYTDGPPDNNAIGGASVFYNYSRDEVKSNHGYVELPPNAIKVQISSAKISDKENFEHWIVAVIDRTVSSEQGKQFNTTTSPLYPYKLAGYNGLAYSVADSTGTNLLSINLSIDDHSVLIITIAPADSLSISDALSMLETLNAKEFDSCSSDVKIPDKQELIPELAIQTETIDLAVEDFTCNLGTFPGSEAQNSTISLQMPFLIGETWIVGGAGAFYGNYHHCNYYNSYYATDWNKPDGNDADALVLAVADGTVSAIDAQCTDIRYGCLVQINHLFDFRTIYAHLSSVYVQLGSNVGKGELIGKVDCTGNCADPHLHLGFWHWDLSDYPYHYEYFSQCYNGGQICSNGETAYFPQGYRPSPMWTTYGNAILADGLPFTSVNGHQIFLPLVNNNLP